MPHARLRCLSASTTTQPLIDRSLLLKHELVYFLLRDGAPRTIPFQHEAIWTNPNPNQHHQKRHAR